MPRKPPYIVFTQPLPTKGQYKIYSVATSESLGMIKGDNRKRYWEAFDNEGNFLKSAERKKQLMDFFREIDKKSRMAEGGGIDNRILVVLDEGNGKVINDLYTQWNNIKTDKDQENWNEKVRNTTFGSYGTVSMNEVLDKFDFDKSEKINSVSKEDFKNELNQALKYAKGGGIGFEKLSNKVAKNYEGKKVAPKYQHEYGKTYSRAEAKEVGDKVAGKVYWQQQGRMATGGNIKKYEYSPSIEEQKTWDEKKTRIYDAYVNSYNSYQDLLQERKRAIGRNDKDEIKSIDLRLKNKLLAIRFAYSELKGRFYEEDFKDGGNLDSLDARISKAIFQAYGDIDDAIEFKFNDPDSGVAPYRLVFLAVQKGFITPEEINKDLLNSAYETSSETADAEEIGSSDMNFYVWSMLRDAGFDMEVENGTYIRVRNKMATGGTTDKMDEYIRKNRERQAKEEEGKYFAPYRAFVYEDSYQFADFKTDDFHKAVKWAKETLEAQRAYRKNTESMWAIVDEFTPIEERNNVIYPYKEVARFTEEDSKEMKFGNGGNTTFYYDQAKKTLGEHLYNHIASLNKEQLEKHLSHLQKEIERMKANDTEFTKQEFLPKYKQEEKFILYLLERLDEFKYADGGNVEEDQEYYRVFRNNAGKDVAVKILKNPIFGKYDYYVDGSLRGQFDTFAQARQEVNYENFDMYKDGGNIYSKEESLQIARTILQQMGGQNRLVAFTGAYGFAYADGDVSFRIKNRKVNYVKVKLNGKDLYDVTFGRVSGTNFKVIEQLDDVYAEDIIDIFEKSTGMYLRFEKGGKMARGGGVGNEKKKDIISFDFQTRTFQGDKEPLEDIIRKIFNIKRRFPPVLNFDKSAMEFQFTEYVSEDEIKSKQYKADLFKKVQAVKSKIEGLYNLSVNYYTILAESWNNFENSIVITIGEKKNYDKGSTFFAKGGGIEDVDFISQARTSARESIDWEEELRNYAGDNYKSLTAKEKEEIIAEMKENYDYHNSYGKGGLVVTSIKDIPNFKEENEAGRITYRGLGMGKLSNDFYKIAGESGTRIKVKGKEYYITNSEFDTFSRDSSGKMRIKFDAPFRRFAKGGGIFNSEFYKDGGSIVKEKYAYVQAKTTTGKNVFKFFEEVPTHKQVYAYFRTVKDENGNPITLKDSTIHVEEITDFDRDLFLEKANAVAISTFGSPIKELDDMMFSFDKHNLSVFKFEAELENGMEVTIQTVDGMIVIEAEEEDEDKFKDGGSIDINFATDTNYIKRENIKLVNYKNGKELYNWDYWDSYNVPAEKDELFSGIYVAHRPLPDKESDKQYSMFKKGGNLTKTEKDKLPKSAFYIKRSDIDSVIIYDEKLGEEVEIPANRIVNGIWFDNERTQMIIDRAKKEGLIPDKTKKTTTFIARFNGKKIELEAKSMFDAEQKALKELKVPKSKRGLLSVMSKQAYERGDFQFN